MKAPAPRNSLLWSGRYQIGMSILLILLEAVLISVVPGRPVSINIIFSTAVFCLLASVTTIAFIKAVGRYPGVEESSYVLFCLTSSYALLLVVLLMMRIPYSRPLIGLSFVTNAFAFVIIYTALRQRTKVSIGLVPEGSYLNVVDMPQVEWRVFDNFDAGSSGIDAVSVDLRNDISDEWERRLASFALEGVPVYDLKHLRESLTGKVEIEHLSENSFGLLNPLRPWMAVKRALDWLSALIALIVLLPFLLIVAFLIRLDSSGPAIFRQVRVGYRGCSFQVYKFRTMAKSSFDDCTSDRDAAMTKEVDNRVTRLGRYLRKSRIDELPQLFNILKGEMSWIGPRPEAEILSHWYEQEIPFYRYRHIVPPGITGWAQVNQGHVAEVHDVTEKLHYDFYYIKHFSLWIDLIIIGRTIRTIATGFGAR